MDTVVDDIMIQARRCERASRHFHEEPLKSLIKKLHEAADKIGESWSGSWLGYHANVYYAGFGSPRPGDQFDPEWGLMDKLSSQTSPYWKEVRSEVVEKEVFRVAGVSTMNALTKAAEEARDVFSESQNELIAIFDALLARKDDATTRDLRNQIAGVKNHIGQDKLLQAIRPAQVMTRDSMAAAQGVKAPPHLALKALVHQQESFGWKITELAKLARRGAMYLEKSRKLKGESVARTEGKVFIGHGRSSAWKDLKDFIQDRLQLPWDEYNREATAGLSRKERLEQMLDEACFSFLIMTAEDQHADRRAHARENVVHEVGLFQGRLGFRRAIVLLEEGCAEFSNIEGIDQLRFPKGNIKAVSEEIRRVLEREGIIKT